MNVIPKASIPALHTVNASTIKNRNKERTNNILFHTSLYFINKYMHKIAAIFTNAV